MKNLKIFFMLIALGSLNALGVFGEELRRPNDHEQFYHYVAHRLNEPDLCEKISSHASFYGDPDKADDVEFYRAECYYDVALQHQRTDLCDKVTPIYKGFKLFAGGYSELSPGWCKKEIGEHDSPNIAFALNDDQLISVFSAMGYKPETLYLEGVTPQIEKLDLTGVYARLGGETDIIERINRANPSSITQAELLYSLAAHVTNDINWCLKIRDAVDPPPSKYGGAFNEHYRDSCIFQIASNTRQKSLCESIPDRPEYRDDILSIKQECYRQVDGQLKHPSDTKYSYLIPKDDQSMIDIINLLGYPLPDIKNISADEIARSYTYFIFALEDQSKPENLSARRKFLERLNKLPSYQ